MASTAAAEGGSSEGAGVQEMLSARSGSPEKQVVGDGGGGDGGGEAANQLHEAGQGSEPVADPPLQGMGPSHPHSSPGQPCQEPGNTGQLGDTKTQVEDTKTQVEDTKVQVEDTKVQVEDTKTQVEDTKVQVEDTKTQVEDTKTQVEDTKTQVEGMQTVPVQEGDVNEECVTGQDPTQDEWMDILGSGQLKKKVLMKGVEASRPSQGNLVTVKVTGRLETGGCVYDKTERFILGDGDVIAAVDLSVALMNKGETAEVITAARFAYGSKGREPDIPGESALTLTLELQDIQPALDLSKLTAEERLAYGEQKRQRGNELFGREDYSAAINSYSKAVKLLDASAGGLTGDTSVLQSIVDSRLKCYNNMAASQLKVGASDAAIRSCEEVLQCQPDNVKALYRQGKAYSVKGQTGKAISFLKKALRLDPESKLLHRELAHLTQKQRKEEESEKIMYKRMMGSMADAATTQKEGGSGTSMWKWSLLAGGIVAAAASVGVAFYRSTH